MEINRLLGNVGTPCPSWVAVSGEDRQARFTQISRVAQRGTKLNRLRHLGDHAGQQSSFNAADEDSPMISGPAPPDR